MIKKTLKNGMVASVGQYATIVYRNEAEYNKAQEAVKKDLAHGCKVRSSRLVNGIYVCGICGVKV